MGLINNTKTNILVSDNSQNDLLMIASRIPFLLTPVLQLRIYLPLMGYMTNIWLILIIVLIFPLNFTIIHDISLLMN